MIRVEAARVDLGWKSDVQMSESCYQGSVTMRVERKVTEVE